MRRKQPERQLQKAVAEFLSHALPPDAFFSSIPGGEGRATRTPGYRAGTPDVLTVYKGRALFVELKSPRGRLSVDQRTALSAIWNAGGDLAICRSLLEVQDFLKLHGIPLRAKVLA